MKIYITLFILSISIITDGYSQVCSLDTVPFIGMNACGGIIYSINESKDFVSVVSHQDLGHDWQNRSQQSCNAFEYLSYNDWFLPSIDDLSEMYESIGPSEKNSLGNIGDFVFDDYWSSDKLNSKYFFYNFFPKETNQVSSANYLDDKYYRAIRKTKVTFNKIFGCTDKFSFNYNSLANTNDSSCIASILGCIDNKYIEYDINANTEDGSCVSLIINGCTSSSYIEFNKDANTDNGTCSTQRELNLLIQPYVENKINIWQIKGEYEKTLDYIERVNNKTRKTLIEKLEKIALDSLKNEFISKINIDQTNLEISNYDADNEVFILTSKLYGEFPINIPIIEAPKFKENYEVLNFLNFDIIIKDNVFVISNFDCSLEVNTEVNIKLKGIEYKKKKSKTYSYSLANKLDYQQTDFTYNFSDIVVGEIENYQGETGFNKTNNALTLGSKVDVDIPSNSKVNNRYALIIGNEDYTSYQSGLSTEQNVDFAENDATIFKEYALKTLGVKQENLHYLVNATAGQMKREITLVSEILKVLESDAELIFYYAGHGYPDEVTKESYLIPVDITATDLSNAINLSDLYKTLTESKSNRVTVFLDACFTGGARSQGLVASRGIKISPKEENLNGNLVVFSASSETQSSLPYYEQGHGMFTYYLLEMLQNSNGDCSYSELFEYVNQKVSLNSLKINKKKQNPKVNTSLSVNENWGVWGF
jgi:hypothetical protein